MIASEDLLLINLNLTQPSIWLRALTEASVVGETVLVTLSGRETTLDGVINLNWVLLGGQGGGDLGVGLGHGVAIDHTADVSSVAWYVLLANVVGRASNPILRMLATVAKDVLVHLSARGQVHGALHALLESNST